VIDASAMVEILLNTPSGTRAERAIVGASLSAPAHFDAEVFSAIARLCRNEPRRERSIGMVVEALAQAPVTRFPCPPLLSTAWRMRANVAARDALYVALAQALKGVLLTADARLAWAPAKRLGIETILV
jgi:predicted nucleic acid-binding protein